MERKKRNHNEGSIRERADGRFESVSQQATILKQGSRNASPTMLKPKQRRFKSYMKRSTRFTFRNTLTPHPPLFLIGCGFGWKPT